MLKALFHQSAPETRTIEADDLGWSVLGGSTSWAGESVTMASSVQLLTVYGCVRMIADGISTLPIDVYRKDSAGVITPLPTPYWLSNPSSELDSIEWRTQILTSLLLDGNGYAHIPSWGPTGQPNEMIPVDPTSVSIVRSSSRKVYLVNGVERDVLHLRGLMWPGKDKGLSPIESARQSIGLGMAATRYGAESFTNENQMPGVIEISGKATGTTMRETARLWQARRREGGRGMPGVLQDGASWKATGVTSEQAQFLGTRKFSAAEIAAQMFLIDPTDLGIPVEGSSITYANLEQRNSRRVQVTFLPWIVRLETALSALLPRGQYCKLNVSALLRGDLAARWAAYNIAETINTSAAARGDAPVMATQEMRDLEEMGPSPETPTPPEPPAAPPAPPVDDEDDA